MSRFVALVSILLVLAAATCLAFPNAGEPEWDEEDSYRGHLSDGEVRSAYYVAALVVGIIIFAAVAYDKGVRRAREDQRRRDEIEFGANRRESDRE